MIAQIFAAIQLLLKLIGLWETFLSWSDKKRVAEAQEREQKRNAAIDKQKHAQTEEEFDKAQSDIVNNPP